MLQAVEVPPDGVALNPLQPVAATGICAVPLAPALSAFTMEAKFGGVL
jgi:hypothetical protein